MKFIDTLIFATSALASVAPPPYPNPYEQAPAPYPTGALPPKYPHSVSAPYPYPTEKKEPPVYKPHGNATTKVESTTCTEDEHTYTTTLSKATDSLTKSIETETKKIVYPTHDDKTATETKKIIVVPTTAEYKTETKTDVETAVTKTKVIVSPTPYHNNDDNDDNDDKKDADKPDEHDDVTVETTTITLTVPAPTSAPIYSTPAACVPVEETVTVTTKLTITVPEPQPTGYNNGTIPKPTVYAPKTITVTPVHESPAPSGSFVPPPASYLPAVNTTKEASPAKPTYSAPVEYTGGAVKAAAGFGALAMAVIALAL